MHRRSAKTSYFKILKFKWNQDGTRQAVEGPLSYCQGEAHAERVVELLDANFAKKNDPLASTTVLISLIAMWRRAWLIKNRIPPTGGQRS